MHQKARQWFRSATERVHKGRSKGVLLNFKIERQQGQTK